MIKHVVFWRLYGEEHGFDKEASKSLFIDELNKLPAQIENIQSFYVGTNLLDSKESADIILESTFNNIDDLHFYQKHPAHLKFIEKIKHLRYERRVVDYKYTVDPNSLESQLKAN
jgi:hypothetical protein